MSDFKQIFCPGCGDKINLNMNNTNMEDEQDTTLERRRVQFEERTHRNESRVKECNKSIARLREKLMDKQDHLEVRIRNLEIGELGKVYAMTMENLKEESDANNNTDVRN